MLDNWRPVPTWLVALAAQSSLLKQSVRPRQTKWRGPPHCKRCCPRSTSLAIQQLGRLRVLPYDNAAEGVSAGCDRRDALQGDGFEHIFPISVWEANWFIIRQPARLLGCAEPEVGPSQAAIAASSGLMPTIFSTRVML